LKNKGFICLLALLIILGLCSQGIATWNIPKTFNLETPPLDVAISRNGTWIFVLTDQGEILIYSSKGSLHDKISIGNHVDQIKAGPIDELLILKSRENKTVQILTPEDAPVVIAVFSEFQ